MPRGWTCTGPTKPSGMPSTSSTGPEIFWNEDLDLLCTMYMFPLLFSCRRRLRPQAVVRLGLRQHLLRAIVKVPQRHDWRVRGKDLRVALARQRRQEKKQHRALSLHAAFPWDTHGLATGLGCVDRRPSAHEGQRIGVVPSVSPARTLYDS